MSLSNNCQISRATSRGWPDVSREPSFKKIILICLFAIFTRNGFSQELSNWYFCFGLNTSLSQVKGYLAPFLLPRDKIYENESDNCLQINLSEGRKELFEKQLRKKFNVKDIYKESGTQILSDVPKAIGQCALDFLTKGKNAHQNSAGSVQIINGVIVSAGKNESSGDSISNSQLLVLSGKSASITVDGKSVQVTCTIKGQTQVELVFGINNSTRSMEYAQTTPQTASASSSNSISSTVYVEEGQELNVGSIVSDLSSKGSTIGTENGIQVGSGKSNLEYNYFIKLKKIIWN